MDALFTIAAIVALAVPVAFVAASFSARGPDWIAAAWLGYRREEGWPRGIQEEDPSFTPTFRLAPALAAASASAAETPEIDGAEPRSGGGIGVDDLPVRAAEAATAWMERVDASVRLR